MSSNKDDVLRQFCDVTGADEDRSKFFLESSNWQLEVALSSFYEHGGNVDDAPPSVPSQDSAQPIALSDSDMESPPTSPSKTQKDKKNKKTVSSRFATLSSLQQESSSDEEEGQAFYAGGSERSGQQILGPGKSRKDIVAEMFKSVRERGAVAFDDEPSTAGRGQSSIFSGVGYRLGQTADDHEEVSTATASTRGGQEPVRSVRLRLYREGFTVDTGPLRHYTDPTNTEFLNCIRRGEIPLELSSGGAEVRVSLEDRRLEECPKHQSKAHAFSGKGHLLGSPTPATVGATEPVPPVADREANERAAQQALSVDEAQPITTIQFRLADGNRISGRFNHSHTVAHLRDYLTTAVPTSQLQNFVLMTTFPSAELTDLTLTLEQAKLLNSVVVQRVK